MSRVSVTNKSKKLIIIVVVLLIALYFGHQVGVRLRVKFSQDKQISEMQQTVSQIEEQNSKMEETIAAGEDESYNEQIARENGYVYPEERVYYDNDAS